MISPRAGPAYTPAVEDQAIEQAFARGKQAWPSIGLDLSTFRSHCERVLGPAPEWDWKRFGPELLLCCACARGDAEATRILEADILPQVVKAISRIDPSCNSLGTESLDCFFHYLRLFDCDRPQNYSVYPQLQRVLDCIE